ncbi:MAG: hypothetical protein KBD01_00140 [Acidobacteria bacterium]|nr:hypothetical protein [Acidobacteriota bacterium]
MSRGGSGRAARAAGLILALLAAGALVSCSSGPPPPPSDTHLPDVALFTRHYLEPIYLEDVPAAEELGHAVKVALTPGEYEPASVGVRTRLHLAQARLVPSDLAGPGGAMIPAAEIRVQITRAIAPLERWRPIPGHRLHPGYLDPLPAVDIAPGTAQQFWVTVHAPRGTPPGKYVGALTFSAAAEQPIEVPLEAEVYPFELGEARPGLFAYGDNWPLAEESLADSRAHGMNTICVNPGWIKQVVPVYAGGAFTFPDGFRPVADVIAAAQRHGLGVEHPIGVMLYQHMVRSTSAGLKMAGVALPPGAETLDYHRGYEVFSARERVLEEVERYRGRYYPSADPFTPETDAGRQIYRGWVEVMRALDRTGRERGWPPLWYYLVDEPHQTRGSMRLAMLMVHAAAEAGADGFVTCNEPTTSEPDEDELWYPPVEGEPALRLEPHLKTRCYHNRYLGPETLARTRASGDRYSTYVNIYGNQPASVRYQAGFLAWRLGLDSVMFWSYEGASTKLEDGTRSFLREWEAVREGIDDLKYLEQLERLVAAPGGDPAALDAARRALERVRGQIVPNVKSIGYVDGQTGQWVPGENSWSAPQYEEIRREIALAIASLAGSGK